MEKISRTHPRVDYRINSGIARWFENINLPIGFLTIMGSALFMTIVFTGQPAYRAILGTIASLVFVLTIAVWGLVAILADIRRLLIIISEQQEKTTK